MYLDNNEMESGGLNEDSVKGLVTALSRIIETKRDRQLNGDETGTLTDIEVENLFRNNFLLRKIISKYPQASQLNGYELVDDNGNIIDETDELLTEAFKEASIYARLYKKSFLHLIFEDEINEEKPLIPSENKKLTDFNVVFDLHREGDFYRHNDERIHFTRMIKFIGVRSYSKMARPEDLNYADSVVQGIFEAFNDFKENNTHAKYILENLSYICVGMTGLARSSTSLQGQTAIYERLQSFNTGRNIYKTVGYDKEKEEINFISQTLGGVIDILNDCKELLAASADYPYDQLFEKPPSMQMGSGVQNQLIVRYLWAKRVREWVISEWLGNYKTFFDRTRDMSNLSVRIPLVVELTEQEEAEIQEKGSNRTKELIESGVISVYEARTGYEDNRYTLNIDLDNETFEKEKTAKENLEQQLNIQAPDSNKSKESLLNKSQSKNKDAVPDDEYWDMLANISITNLDVIGEEMIS